MKKIQFKAAPGEGLESKQGLAKVEVKGEGEGGILRIKAYALAFGNVDSYGDIILAGACDEFLASDTADRMALCWQHDRSTVIGKITDKGVDDYGMWITADVLPTTAGKDAAILLKAGAVKEFSIGYRATKYHYEKREGYEWEIRIIEALEVYEVSPVTIAANDKAKLITAKNRQDEGSNNSPKSNNTTMTPEEIKAMRESIEKAAADKAPAEVKAAQEAVKAAQEKIEAQEKSIDNLDKSMKALQAQCDELRKKRQEEAQKTFFTAFQEAVESKRADIEAMLKSQKGSIKVEFKADVDTGDITNYAYGVALEPGVHSARPLANVFWDAFAKDTVTANQFNWLEGTFTDATDYVDELAAPSDNSAVAVEKSRKFGKLASHLRVSSEVANFFEEVYNWARNTAQRKIYEKIDAEIYSGLGNDTANTGTGASPKKVYGLKSNSTAFSALGSYSDATIADVILDAQIQAQKYGYTIDKVFVTFAELAELRGLKNKNGNYLYNEVTGMLNGVQILPTPRLAAGELLAVDSSIVRIKQRPTWEFEIVRNANLDGWDVYVRKSVQTQVKTNDKYGVIYVANIDTAIASLAGGSGSGSGSGV